MFTRSTLLLALLAGSSLLASWLPRIIQGGDGGEDPCGNGRHNLSDPMVDCLSHGDALNAKKHESQCSMRPPYYKVCRRDGCDYKKFVEKN